nr:lipopolysaccharide biosynthesis protein [Opacimonas viscosa]
MQIKLGFIWSTLESFGNKAISLILSLILAKQLGPSAYGLFAMLAIFIAIAGVFVNSGFNSALIRKTDRNEKDFATTFYFSLVVSIICYGLLFISAPFISTFYDQPQLIDLTRVIALIIIIQAFAIIPKTRLTVSLDFKSQAVANVVGLLSGGTIGLTMAFNGYGVWSLVFQQLISSTINVCILNLQYPWKPLEKFCRKTFKELFGFGSKLLVSGLIDTIYQNIYGLIIGKQFSAAKLGVFNQAQMISMLPAITMTEVIQKVTYPLLSNIQEDRILLEKAYLLMLKVSALTIFPVVLGLSIISEPLIYLILGSEWQESAQFISVLCVGFMIYPIQAINLNLLQVKGRSDLFLKLEIIKKINLTVMLIVTVPLGVYEMCIGIVVTSYLALLINTYYTGKLTTISQIDQLIALFPIWLIVFISAALGFASGLAIESEWIQIIVMLLTALLSYMSLMFVFQKNLLLETVQLIRGHQ